MQHPNHRDAAPALPPPPPPPTQTRVPAHTLGPDPVIPPINAYGSTATSHLARPHYLTHYSHSSFSSSSSDDEPDERRPLLPGMVAPGARGLIGGVSSDLIPFSGVAAEVAGWFGACFGGRHTVSASPDVEAQQVQAEADALGGTSERHYWTHAKHRPRIAGGGQNVPLQVVRCLTSYLSVCEERGCVPGACLFLSL